MDDIYEFEYTNIPLEISFYSNGNPIDSVQVSLEKNGKIMLDSFSIKKITENLEPNSNYTIKASKDGYINSELKIKTTQNKKPIVKSISLTPILKEEEKDEK